MSKKYLIILASAALVIIILVLKPWAGNKQAQNGQQASPGQSQPIPIDKQGTLEVVKTDVPVNQTPEGFPANIPIEQGAKITQNYTATAPNGLTQATRVFVTAKSLDDNFKLYTTYLKTNSWTIVNSLNLSNVKVLSAKKGTENLQITISQNSITKAKTVDISYTAGK